MPAKHKLPIQDAARLFLSDRKAQRMADATIRFYTEKIGNFITWCEVEDLHNIEDISPTVVRQFFAELPGRGYAANTQNMLGRAVRAFLRWCFAEGIVQRDAMKNVRIPQPPKEVLPALKPEEVRALVDAAADGRAKAMVLFLLDTGVRAREFIDLNGGDIDLSAGTVRVRRGKTNKTRITFLSPASVKALLAYFREEGWPEGDEPLWRSRNTGGRLTDSGMRQVLQDTAKAAGVKGGQPHQFRRTMALASLRAGVDVHVLAKMLGHADIRVLKYYLDIDESDTHEAHRKANIVGRFLK